MKIYKTLAIAAVLAMLLNTAYVSGIGIVGILTSATATLTPTSAGVKASGKVLLNVYTPFGAVVNVTLTGALEGIVMAHIRWNTTDQPILLALLPASTTTEPVPLNPPLNYRGGTFSWQTRISLSKALSATPGMNEDFYTLLRTGRVYVSVQTEAFPSGALVGTLKCTSGCW